MGESRGADGRERGRVAVDLDELIELDRDALLERLSLRLIGHGGLVDLDYRLVGHVGDTLYLEVSGVEELCMSTSPAGMLARIAREVLGIETLEARGLDRLDFHDLNVSALRDALSAAYEAGRLTTDAERVPPPTSS